MEWVLLLEEDIKLLMCLTIVIKCVTHSGFPVALFFFYIFIFLFTFSDSLLESLDLALVFMSSPAKNIYSVFSLAYLKKRFLVWSTISTSMVTFYLLANLTNPNHQCGAVVIERSLER